MSAPRVLRSTPPPSPPVAAPGRGGDAARLALLVFAAVGILVLFAGRAAAQEDGEALFRATCGGCHGPTGAGTPGIFPPLAGNPSVEDAEYVRQTVRGGKTGPIEVLGITYNGQMPAFGDLTDSEVDAIISWVRGGLQEQPVATTLPGVTIPPVSAGAAAGERLFLGQVVLEHGGPACVACHTAGRYSDISGVAAALATDLTGVWDRVGSAEGLAATIADAAGKVHAVYSENPVSGAEYAALAAYFSEGVDHKRVEFLDSLLIIAAAVFFALVAATALVAAGRRERMGSA